MTSMNQVGCFLNKLLDLVQDFPSNFSDPLASFSE